MKKKWHDFCERVKRWWSEHQFAPYYGQSVVTIERYAPGSGTCLTHRPEIWISPEDYVRLFTYIRHCPQEISGLGRVRIDELSNGDLVLSDIMLFKQKVTGGDTDLDQEAIGKLVTDIVMAGGEPEDLKLWWHSHNSMSVFWSKGQDEKTIANLRRFGMEYLVSIVGNHAGDYLCRLDIFKPLHVTIDNIPIRIITQEADELRTQVMREIEDKVSGYQPRKQKSEAFAFRR